MKLLLKLIFFACLSCLVLTECKKDNEPQPATCGCESDVEVVINNVSGKIEIDTSKQPVAYWLQGYYGNLLEVCIDSTFQTMMAQQKIMNGDSVLFGGEGKNICADCEFCALISITAIRKK